MKKFVSLLLVIVIVLSTVVCVAEETEEDVTKLYVMTKSLYGRIRPGKKFQAICEFELGCELVATGRMSNDHMWVEVVSGESDYVWCNVNYLTERIDVFHVYSLGDEKIKIRKCPGYGKVTGYARKEEVLEITQVVFGYGRCSKGWIDLSYFIEDYE